MNSKVESVIAAFVEGAADSDFVILIDPNDPQQFVQFMRKAGTVYAEVSSRQWAGDESRPISDSAELKLMQLGFTHGGPGKNFAQDGLANDAPYLKHVAAASFATAFGEPLPEAPTVVSTVPAVRSLVLAVGGRLEAVGKPTIKRGFFCPVCEDRNPFADRGLARAGLVARARRVLRSNFFVVQLDCEDHVKFVQAVRATETFDALPEQVQDWILKAEEGPLF